MLVHLFIFYCRCTSVVVDPEIESRPCSFNEVDTNVHANWTLAGIYATRQGLITLIKQLECTEHMWTL